MRFYQHAFVYAIALFVVMADRFTKSLAQTYLSSGSTVPIIPGLLDLTLVKNTGIAFGLFPQATTLITIGVIIFLASTVYIINRMKRTWDIPFGLIVGGAAGNLFDRLISDGAVLDFIHVRFFSVFNFADIAVTVGIIWLLMNEYLFSHPKASLTKKNRKA